MSLTVYGRNPVMNVTIQMKPLQRHFFCMVLGVLLSLWMKSLSLTIKLNATELWFP